MSIFRIQKTGNFIVMDKTSIQDKRLSWKAKGLHAYMLSMPNDWKFYDVELEKHAKDGKDSLKTAIKELKENGYMKRVRRRNDQGKFDWETLVFEQPYAEKPSMENPPMEKPLVENPQLLNNDSTKNLNKATVSPFEFYQRNFGVLSPYLADSIGQWIDDLGEELLIEAMKRTLKQQKNFKYCEGILKGWHRKNIRTMDEATAEENRFQSKKGQAPSNQNYREVSKEDMMFG